MAKKKYIEREAVNNVLDELMVNDSLYNALQAIPAADVAPVKHGRWEVGYFHDRVCSCCTHPSNDLSDYPYPYCPNCGAKIDGGEDNA